MEASADAAPKPLSHGPRLVWLDVVKGISILWIVFFHFFKQFTHGRFPDPWLPHYFAKSLALCAPGSAIETIACVGRAIFVAIAMFAFPAVGVFIVMSGFGLTYALAKTDSPPGGWLGWDRARVIRLFPLYWTAHLIYLISPFEARYDPIDYRFILSFFGDRIYPTSIIEYLNPAWWYFGLIFELYLIFPILYVLLHKVGAKWFLVACAGVTILCRYILLFNIIQTSGMVITAFCGCRLWEFAFGMVLGVAYRKYHDWIEKRLFSTPALWGGILLYTAGLYCFNSRFTYIFMDALTGTGLFVILAHLSWHSRRLVRSEAFLAHVGVYSYGLYLIHEPYSTYFGVQMRWMTMPGFIIATAAIIAVITIACSRLERAINALVDRLLHHPGAPLAKAQ